MAATQSEAGREPGLGGLSLPVSTTWTQDMKILPGSSLEHLDKVHLYRKEDVPGQLQYVDRWMGGLDFHTPNTQTGCEHDLPDRELVVLIGRGDPCTITQAELTECLRQVRAQVALGDFLTTLIV